MKFDIVELQRPTPFVDIGERLVLTLQFGLSACLALSCHQFLGVGTATRWDGPFASSVWGIGYGGETANGQNAYRTHAGYGRAIHDPEGN